MSSEHLQGNYVRKSYTHWAWWIETPEGVEVLSGEENNAHAMKKVIKLFDHVRWKLIK